MDGVKAVRIPPTFLTAHLFAFALLLVFAFAHRVPLAHPPGFRTASSPLPPNTTHKASNTHTHTHTQHRHFTHETNPAASLGPLRSLCPCAAPHMLSHSLAAHGPLLPASSQPHVEETVPLGYTWVMWVAVCGRASEGDSLSISGCGREQVIGDASSASDVTGVLDGAPCPRLPFSLPLSPSLSLSLPLSSSLFLSPPLSSSLLLSPPLSSLLSPLSSLLF
eukprot:2845475-Rhodomonas_salina.1